MNMKNFYRDQSNQLFSFSLKLKLQKEKVFKQRENVYNSLAEEVGSEDDREGVTLTSH